MTQPTSPGERRIAAVDIVRGYAMLAMLLSHTTWRIEGFDYRVAFGWDNLIVPDLSAPHSLIGFILQAASPIFFLLSGFGLLLFVESRRQRGWSEGSITRFLVIRGLVLLALEFGFVNLDLAPGTYGHRISVLTAIGISIIALAFLRRLPPWLLAAMMLALVVFTQAIYYTQGRPSEPSLLYAVLLSPHDTFPWSVEFPILPWLPVVMLGYFSALVVRRGWMDLERYTLRLALLLFGLWLAVIVFNDLGNLYTDRRLIFTKHPPDLAYLSLYTGATFGLLWLHTRFSRVNAWLPLRLMAVLGQSALVFYILHVKILDLLSFVLVGLDLPPLEISLLMALAALPALALICWRYQALRRRHPHSLLRYL